MARSADSWDPARTRSLPRVGGMLLLLVGVGFWGNYVHTTTSGFHVSRPDAAFVAVGFLLWLVPWVAGTLTTMRVADGKRRRLVLAAGILLLTVAIGATIAGAAPPPPTEFPAVP